MMTKNSPKSQRKKRDPSYYREYRRRKKYGTQNILPFRMESQGEGVLKTPSNGGKMWSLISHTKRNIIPILVFAFIFSLTGILIHLSALFYMKNHSLPMAYLMASLVELSLLFLLTVQTTGRFDHLARYLLIIALSVYALVPIALNPVHAAKLKVESGVIENKIQSLKLTSIQSEIATRKEKATLLQERGRLTLAQLELQKIAELEEGLRNTATTLKQPSDNLRQDLQSSYAIAIQRFLLMLCNLFFVHHVMTSRRNTSVARKYKNNFIANATCCVT
jgi:hypothetical protein